MRSKISSKLIFARVCVILRSRVLRVVSPHHGYSIGDVLSTFLGPLHLDSVLTKGYRFSLSLVDGTGLPLSSDLGLHTLIAGRQSYHYFHS